MPASALSVSFMPCTQEEGSLHYPFHCLATTSHRQQIVLEGSGLDALALRHTVPNSGSRFFANPTSPFSYGAVPLETRSRLLAAAPDSAEKKQHTAGTQAEVVGIDCVELKDQSHT